MIYRLLYILTVLATVLNLNTYQIKAANPCDIDPISTSCLSYLQEQAEILRKKKNSIKGKISDEQYNQLSLLQRIEYLDQQVLASETQIKQLEFQIESKNVEVRMLTKNIEVIQNNVDTIFQEVTKLENAIEKRMVLTYKYSFITPLEIFLESSNFDSLLRRFKYLVETRKRDKELITKLSQNLNQLKNEETVLATKRSELEIKRSEIEKDKEELFTEKMNLSKQKSEKSNLLAISKQKVASYSSSVIALNKQEGKIASQISNIIFNLYKSGSLKTNTPVKKGQIVGYQGHTGYSYGSHLHFELRKNGVIINPYTTGYFTKYSGSGSAKFPMDNAVVSFPHWDGSNAVDMHSANNYLYGPNDYYKLNRDISCYGLPVIKAGQYFTLKGEGAPLYAIKDGYVSNVFVDKCGGKAVIVDYGGGLTSLYLHLR